MGNIFKTLGIDDMVRTIPGIGNYAGDFLAGLGKDNKIFNTGKTEGRMSNEDYQFNQDLLDSSNPRAANRQNEYNTLTNQTNINNESAFLAGVAPAQAEAHNTFQDRTYQAAIDRETAGIKSQAAGLGMSPWELTGQSTGGGGGAVPPGSQRPSSQQSDGAQFLSTMTPLAVAKMNNETSLKTAKMNNETSRYIADQQTNQGEIGRATTAQTKAQTVQTAAQTTLTMMQTGESSARTSNLNTQSALAENQMWLNSVTTMLQALPTINIDTGLFKSTEKDGWREILKMLGQTDKSNLQSMLSKTVDNIPPPQFDALTKDIIKMASMFATGAKGALNTVASLDGLFLTLKNMLK